MKPEELKLVVRQKYGEIAGRSKSENASSCCGGTSCCSDGTYTVFSDDYSGLSGYQPDADLGLGCGLPTEYAGIQPGNRVLDLGSGAGNDCFVARSLTGEEGWVTGLDFTDEMLEKANRNLRKTGFTNVEFIKGDIENMPLPESSYDVVISNCVLNLVPDKAKAFSEIARVLKPGGHFCVSDIVLKGELPVDLRSAVAMYAGCVSGALQEEDYLAIIKNAGFQKTLVRKRKPVDVPDEILLEFITEKDLQDFRSSGTGIFSITITASKYE